MEHMFAWLAGAVLWLLGLIVAAIGVAETAARHGLAGIGITGPAQSVSLAILLVLLIVAALRLFGRLLAILVVLALLVLLVHALFGPAIGGVQG